MLGALLLVHLFLAGPREPVPASHGASPQAIALPKILKITFTGLVQLMRRSNREVEVIIPSFRKHRHYAYAAFPATQLVDKEDWTLRKRCKEAQSELDRYVELGDGEQLTVHPRFNTQEHQESLKVEDVVADLVKLAPGAPLKDACDALIKDCVAATMVLRSGPLYYSYGKAVKATDAKTEKVEYEPAPLWKFCKHGELECDPPRCLARGVILILEFDSAVQGVVLRSSRDREVTLAFDKLNQADLEIGNISGTDLKCPKYLPPAPDPHFLHHYKTLNTPQGFEGKYPHPAGGECKEPEIVYMTASGDERRIIFTTPGQDPKKMTGPGTIVIRSAVGENCPPGSGGP